ncbi:MAG: sensor histidine kinase [Erysipelotrichaceae bacterium]
MEYIQKVKYYQEVALTFEHLEQRYMLGSLLPEPHFEEADILHELIYEMGKSMSEEISGLKHAQMEYQEYIERWVHEIKTPIAAIQLLVENKEHPQLIVAELQEVEDFIQQVLYYARSQNPEKDFVVKELLLRSFLDDVLKKYARKFIMNKIQLTYEVGDDIVYTDSKWASYIIGQIISNALKYSQGDNKRIVITAQEHQNSVTLCIQDEGIGIPKAELDHIFDKGFTGSNGRIYSQSTGMGLYLCKTLCDKLYIGIEVDSTVAVGTTISLTFPKAAIRRI